MASSGSGSSSLLLGTTEPAGHFQVEQVGTTGAGVVGAGVTGAGTGSGTAGAASSIGKCFEARESIGTQNAGLLDTRTTAELLKTLLSKRIVMYCQAI